MFDTPDSEHPPLSHDLPCNVCGHPMHTYLPCSDTCGCLPSSMPGGPDWPGLAAA
jgi:hypothetical protein